MIRDITDDSSRKGDYAEHLAVIWLWEQGYEVFRNAGCTGKIDMLATKGDEIIKVDVKTLNETSTRGNGKLCFRAHCHEEQRGRGIRFLFVRLSTKEVGWNRDYFAT